MQRLFRNGIANHHQKNTVALYWTLRDECSKDVKVVVQNNAVDSQLMEVPRNA